MSSEQAGAGSPFSRATFTFESACIRIRFGSHSLFSRSREWDSDRCWFAYDSVVNACSQAIHSMFRQCITSVPHTAEIHTVGICMHVSAMNMCTYMVLLYSNSSCHAVQPQLQSRCTSNKYQQPAPMQQQLLQQHAHNTVHLDITKLKHPTTFN
jgi:hypothetical protein